MDPSSRFGTSKRCAGPARVQRTNNSGDVLQSSHRERCPHTWDIFSTCAPRSERYAGDAPWSLRFCGLGQAGTLNALLGGPQGWIMARILVLYGTTDGHTAKVAATVAEVLRTSGAAVDVIKAGTKEPVPEQYAGVIVAASVHARGYQRSVRQWVRRHAEALRGKPSAFLSVSLGVLQQDPDVQREVDAIVSDFLGATRWQPAMVQNVAGAVLYTKYNAIKRWIMRRIVAKAGGATDTSRDYEYTNWAELRAFAERFNRTVAV